MTNWKSKYLEMKLKYINSKYKGGTILPPYPNYWDHTEIEADEIPRYAKKYQKLIIRGLITCLAVVLVKYNDDDSKEHIGGHFVDATRNSSSAMYDTLNNRLTEKGYIFLQTIDDLMVEHNWDISRDNIKLEIFYAPKLNNTIHDDSLASYEKIFEYFPDNIKNNLYENLWPLYDSNGINTSVYTSDYVKQLDYKSIKNQIEKEKIPSIGIWKGSTKRKYPPPKPMPNFDDD